MTFIFRDLTIFLVAKEIKIGQQTRSKHVLNIRYNDFHNIMKYFPLVYYPLFFSFGHIVKFRSFFKLKIN
jgi:hypothetical protein